MMFYKSIFHKVLLIGWIFLFSNEAVSQNPVTAIDTTETAYFTEEDIQIDNNNSIQKLTFPPNFQSKYKNADFDYEVKPHVKNAWERFVEWLSDKLRGIFDFADPQTSISVVGYIFKTIAVLIILLVIYLIVKSIMNKDGKWIFGKNSDRKMIRYDEIEKNLHLVDFEKLIKETLQSGEKRLSIRYYYLWLLKKMSEKQIIEWDSEKTNSDYLYEISNEKLKDNFGYLSYLYNYIWYGEFEIDEATFEKAKLTFEKTIQSL